MTELNSATSYLMRRAVRGQHPELRLDYPAVLIARGELPPPEDAKAEADADGNLHLHWNYDPERRPGRGYDRGLVLAWCPALEEGEWAEASDSVYLGRIQI